MVDSVLPIKFSDGSEGTLEDVRFKLDQWVDQYVVYHHLPNDLHGSFISIDHPTWGNRSSYAVSNDDVESAINSLQSVKRDTIYWTVDTKSLE